MYDVMIIGGGVVGCALARELAKFQLKVLLAEKENDVAMGTSKANSGIVHAGFDAHTGTNKAKFNVAGAAMFEELSRELEFPYRQNGAMVLCFDKKDEPKLVELQEQGFANGVKDLFIIGGDEARAKEPNVSKQVTAALYAPTSGIVCPYEMTIAFAENAAENGVEFLLNACVQNVKKIDDGFCVTVQGKEMTSRIVVNCAGVYSDEINNMVCDDKLKIVSRKGEYCLLDKNRGDLANATLFQLPTAMGKGVLVAPTMHGNIIVGPTAYDVESKDDVDTTYDGLADAFSTAKISVPSLDKKDIITQFAGLRAHGTKGDFVVGESKVKGFFNAACVESPGLTSAPAIAKELAEEIASELKAAKKANFKPHRKAIPHFASLSDEERQKLIEQDPRFGKMVCRCETVTEGEIVAAIRRPLGATDMDGVKRRARAGMGRCQAGLCTPAIMEILARELGKDMTEITKCGEGTLVVGRTK